MKDLLVQSTELSSKAKQIFAELGLKDFLSKYGEVYIVGSVELDLMTWRDIDIEIISPGTPAKNDAMDIATFLFLKEGIRKVSPIDYSDSDGVKKPKGLYVGSEYTDESREKWKMDVWLLTKDSARTKDITAGLKERITPETRKNILDIKSQLHDNPKYRKEITSMDIYTAVLDKNVTDIKTFADYLETMGKSL